MKKVYLSSEEIKAPLSGAMEVNGMLFLSGQIHADKGWNLLGESMEEKFDIVMKNIENILKEANMEIKDIINLRLYLTDLSELADINRIYDKYFEHPMPTRTAIEVRSLPLGASLEIEVIAHK